MIYVQVSRRVWDIVIIFVKLFGTEIFLKISLFPQLFPVKNLKIKETEGEQQMLKPSINA